MLATEPPPIVLLFSGGQDSTTCLIHLLQGPCAAPPQQLHCLMVDYGQRHRAELAAAQALATHFGVAHQPIFDASLLNQLATSSLTRTELIVPTVVTSALPNTFVPGRNILFLTLAAIYAYQVGAQRIVTGLCETDYSGYPDCRAQFVQALTLALNLGLERALSIETPLMCLNKAETWGLADYYGQLELVRQRTLTCYHGQLGEGCGDCPACHLRARGLQHYRSDPESYLAALRKKVTLA